MAPHVYYHPWKPPQKKKVALRLRRYSALRLTGMVISNHHPSDQSPSVWHHQTPASAEHSCAGKILGFPTAESQSWPRIYNPSSLGLSHRGGRCWCCAPAGAHLLFALMLWVAPHGLASVFAARFDGSFQQWTASWDAGTCFCLHWYSARTQWQFSHPVCRQWWMRPISLHMCSF